MTSSIFNEDSSTYHYRDRCARYNTLQQDLLVPVVGMLPQDIDKLLCLHKTPTISLAYLKGDQVTLIPTREKQEQIYTADVSYLHARTWKSCRPSKYLTLFSPLLLKTSKDQFIKF